MDGWMDGLIDGWMDRWMDGCIDGWMDGWIDGWTGQTCPFPVYIYKAKKQQYSLHATFINYVKQLHVSAAICNCFYTYDKSCVWTVLLLHSFT